MTVVRNELVKSNLSPLCNYPLKTRIT